MTRSGGRTYCGRSNNSQVSGARPSAALPLALAPRAADIDGAGIVMLSQLPRALAGPALEGMGEGADLAIAEQPGDAGDGKAFRQITSREIDFQLVEDLRKAQACVGEPSRQRAMA